MATKTSTKKQRRMPVFKAEEIGKELTERQELFVMLYLTDKECFGNASKSYSRAYSLKDKQIEGARRSAYALLTNLHIKAYIDKTLKSFFDPAHVDNELGKVISQNKDLQSKVRAIEAYNKLKDRSTDKMEGTFIIKWADPKTPAAKKSAEKAVEKKTKEKFGVVLKNK